MAASETFVQIEPQWLCDVSLTVEYAFEEIESALKEGNMDKVLREADEIAGVAETIRRTIRVQAKLDGLAYSEGTEALPCEPNEDL